MPGRRIFTFVFALSITGTGCSETAGPEGGGFEAAFALRSVNGHELPATVAEGGGQRYVLLADTLRFQVDGTVARTTVFRHFSTTPSWPADTIYRTQGNLPYDLNNKWIIIGSRSPCPPNAICIGSETALITPRGLRVVARLRWPGEPILEFDRFSTR